MIGGVTRLCGLPGLSGRVSLSAGVTICHVNISRWVNSLARVAFMAKSSKAKHPGVVILYVNAFYFSITARLVTSPT